MEDPKTVKETIVAIFGDEFPIIEKMSPTTFKHFFGCWPKMAIEKMTLTHTYKVSEYVNDDHATVLDCIVATAGLVRTCKKCGCTNSDCSMCIEKTGDACYWVEKDLCSACTSRDEKPCDSNAEELDIEQEFLETDHCQDCGWEYSAHPNSN